MVINDTKVTGMFLYDSNVPRTFTKNDFVVKNGVIYICKEDSYEDPESSDNFEIYLGNQSMEAGEFLKFLEDGEGENKYLSVGMLQAVLNHFLLGPDGKGIIGDYIYLDPETGDFKIRLDDKESEVMSPESILVDILMDPNINHALIRVSRFLPEIFSYVGDPGVNDSTPLDEKSCLLKQYTYLQEGTGDIIRIQELIDSHVGLIYYREGNVTQGTSGTFKCSVVNSRTLKERGDYLMGVFNSRLKVMRSLEEHLKSNFRFRKIDLQGNVTSIELTTTDTSSSTYVPNFGEVTILVSMNSTGITLRNSEITINLQQKIGSTYPEYIVGKYKIRVTSTSPTEITLTLLENGNTPTGAWISSVYFKEYYDGQV